MSGIDCWRRLLPSFSMEKILPSRLESIITVDNSNGGGINICQKEQLDLMH